MPRKNVAYAWADFSTGGGGKRERAITSSLKHSTKKVAKGKTKKI